MKARCDQGFSIARENLIARDLFPDEAVIGLVGVKRAHDVVTVAPRVRPFLVSLVTVGIGIARHIEPAKGPALPVVRRSKQPVHCFFIRPVSSIVEEEFDFGRRRWHTGQVIGNTEKQALAVERRRRSKSLRTQPVEDEGVNGSARPAAINLRDSRPDRRSKGPPVPAPQHGSGVFVDPGHEADGKRRQKRARFCRSSHCDHYETSGSTGATSPRGRKPAACERHQSVGRSVGVTARFRPGSGGCSNQPSPRNWRRRNFPVAVFGISVTNATSLGYLYAAMRSLQNWTISDSSIRPTYSFFSATNAFTVSPR